MAVDRSRSVRSYTYFKWLHDILWHTTIGSIKSLKCVFHSLFGCSIRQILPVANVKQTPHTLRAPSFFLICWLLLAEWNWCGIFHLISFSSWHKAIRASIGVDWRQCKLCIFRLFIIHSAVCDGLVWVIIYRDRWCMLQMINIVNENIFSYVRSFVRSFNK